MHMRIVRTHLASPPGGGVDEVLGAGLDALTPLGAVVGRQCVAKHLHARPVVHAEHCGARMRSAADRGQFAVAGSKEHGG